MDARRTAEAVWRRQSARLVITLTRALGDFGPAEHIARETFAYAREQWPQQGVPKDPDAWLLTVAGQRTNRTCTDQEMLALVYLTFHPVLSRLSRAALGLRVVGGLSTEEIARLFLVSPTTLTQRINQAKQTLTEADVRLALPDPKELPTRLEAVLEVVYLVFSEGYAASSGERWIRRDLAEEAMRLGRTLAYLLPDENEVHGLVALMEIQASRFAARIGPHGEHILLENQDRTRWDRTLATHGLQALARAEKSGTLGPYSLQAAIAACHARAPTFEDTDWRTIAVLYEALARLTASPFVALNHAVALLHADGPCEALEAVDAVRKNPRMARHHLVGAVRGEVLMRMGRLDEAAEELERAAGLAPTKRERIHLMERAAATQRQAT